MVVRIAEQSGIRYLFTSTPFMGIKYIGKCVVIGRYGIKNFTSNNLVLKLAQGNNNTWMLQKFIWDSKKQIQKLFGDNYTTLRKFYYKFL